MGTLRPRLTDDADDCCADCSAHVAGEPAGDALDGIRFRGNALQEETGFDGDESSFRLHRCADPQEGARARATRRSAEHGVADRHQAARRTREVELRLGPRGHGRDRRTPQHAVCGPQGRDDPDVRRRNGARVRRPRKPHHSALARE